MNAVQAAAVMSGYCVGPAGTMLTGCPMLQVRDMAKKAAAAGINTLVIDTENKFVSTGFAEEIAKAANGKYYYLPNASDAAIAAAASSAMAQAKAGV